MRVGGARRAARGARFERAPVRKVRCERAPIRRFRRLTCAELSSATLLQTRCRGTALPPKGSVFPFNTFVRCGPVSVEPFILEAWVGKHRVILTEVWIRAWVVLSFE